MFVFDVIITCKSTAYNKKKQATTVWTKATGGWHGGTAYNNNKHKLLNTNATRKFMDGKFQNNNKNNRATHTQL